MLNTKMFFIMECKNNIFSLGYNKNKKNINGHLHYQYYIINDIQDF